MENGTSLERNEARNSLGLLPEPTQRLNSCHLQESQAAQRRLHLVIYILSLKALQRILLLPCEC